MEDALIVGSVLGPTSRHWPRRRQVRHVLPQNCRQHFCTAPMTPKNARRHRLAAWIGMPTNRPCGRRRTWGASRGIWR